MLVLPHKTQACNGRSAGPSTQMPRSKRISTLGRSQRTLGSIRAVSGLSSSVPKKWSSFAARSEHRVRKWAGATWAFYQPDPWQFKARSQKCNFAKRMRNSVNHLPSSAD